MLRTLKIHMSFICLHMVFIYGSTPRLMIVLRLKRFILRVSVPVYITGHNNHNDSNGRMMFHGCHRLIRKENQITPLNFTLIIKDISVCSFELGIGLLKV